MGMNERVFIALLGFSLIFHPMIWVNIFGSSPILKPLFCIKTGLFVMSYHTQICLPQLHGIKTITDPDESGRAFSSGRALQFNVIA